MTDAALIEAMARAICNHEDGDERHIGWHTKVAQAALDALKAEGWMLVKWERVYSDPDDLHVIDTSIEYVVDFDKEGDGYQLVGLEPPKGA